MSEHDLKCWPEPFTAIVEGRKRHEIRVNDRGFAVGNILHLQEYVPPHDDVHGFYTGRTFFVRVTYLTPGGAWGLPDGLCVMSIEVP